MMKLITSAPWIDAIEARLSLAFPRVVRDFLSTHEFIGVETPTFSHYHNTDSDDSWSLPVALFKDKFIFEPAVAGRFIPIGQPEEGNYDRICLDLNHVKNGDCPLVQLDHEDLLQFERIRVIKEIYPSYNHFIKIIKTEPSGSANLASLGG